MSKIKKQRFTLLEILVVLVIIGLASSVLLWKAGALMQHHRFSASTALLKRQLEHAACLSLTYQTDLTLSLRCKAGNWQLDLCSDEPRLQNMRGESLKGIQKIRWKGKKRTGVLSVKFSSGICQNPGVFLLESDQGEQFLLNFTQPSHVRLSIVETD